MPTVKFSKQQVGTLIQENRKRLLNERTSSVVYHWTSLPTAKKILDDTQFSLMSTMFKGAEADLVGTSHNHMYYLSMTRNGKIGMGGYSNPKHPWVRFTLNGDLLNANFHIKALDYWGASMGKMSRYTSGKENYGKIHKPQSETESEDRLYSKQPFIEDALRYIESIDIYFDLNDTKSENYDKYLELILSIMYHAHKICSLYSSVDDFNKQKNAIDFNTFAEFSRNYKTKSDYLPSPDLDRDLDERFLASVAYVVNFPNGTFEDCMRTIREYGLEKYASRVAKYIKHPTGWDNIFLFNTLKVDFKDGNIKRILSRHFEQIQIANSAQRLKRQDLANGFRILTDFCGKHKLNNYQDLTNYLIDKYHTLKREISGEWNDTMEITCAMVDDELCVCVDPSVCHYKDVFYNGKNNLYWIYDDISRHVESHKSSSYSSFESYIKRLLLKGNPTVQQVIDLFDKLKSLGNDIDESYKPQLVTQSVDYYNLSRLIEDNDYSSTTACYSTDSTRLYLYDASQKEMLYNMWQKKLKNNLKKSKIFRAS